MNIEESETVPEKKKTKWLWIVITIIFILSLVFTVFMFSKNVIAKTNQNEIYIPETVDQSEATNIIKPIQINNNEKVLLMLGFILLIVVWFDRKWQGQSQDVIATIVGIALIFLGGYIDKLSENSLVVIVASIIIVYLAAFLGKLDFSAPGGYWGVIAILGVVLGNIGAFQIHYNISNSFLLPIQDVVDLVIAKSTEPAVFSIWIYSMIIISALHFLLELLGLRLEIIKERGKRGSFLHWNVRWAGLGIALVMILIPYLLTEYTDLKLWLVMFIATGISVVLVLSKQQFIVGARTNEESFSSAAVGRVMLQSQWDGIAFGIILNVGLILLTNLYV